MSAVTQPAVLSATRHILSSIGGALALYGFVDAGMWELIAGGVVTIAGIVWGIVDKVIRHRRGLAA